MVTISRFHFNEAINKNKCVRGNIWIFFFIFSIEFRRQIKNKLYSTSSTLSNIPAGIYLLTLTIETLEQGVKYVQS